jgi:hypothetical protein
LVTDDVVTPNCPTEVWHMGMIKSWEVPTLSVAPKINDPSFSCMGDGEKTFSTKETS